MKWGEERTLGEWRGGTDFVSRRKETHFKCHTQSRKIKKKSRKSIIHAEWETFYLKTRAISQPLQKFFLFREECHRALKCRPTQNVPQNGRRENKFLGFYTRIFVRRLRACRMRKIHWATTTNRFNTVILIVPSYGKRRYASSENGGSMKPSTSTREVEGGEVKFLPRLDLFFPSSPANLAGLWFAK